MDNITNYTLDELKEVASACKIPVAQKSKVGFNPRGGGGRSYTL